MNILFLCVRNSARSQMAEGIAKKFLQEKGIIQCAGSEPNAIHPLAIKVMQEIDIDISNQESKSMTSINPDSVEYVITLCAEESCPLFLHNKPQIHWPLLDPSTVQGTEEEKMIVFRQIRDELFTKIKKFIEL